MYSHIQQFEYWLDWLYTGVVTVVFKTDTVLVQCNLWFAMCACVLKFILIYKNYYDEVQVVHFVTLKLKFKLKFKLQVVITDS
jgi:hypothetical protein